MTNSKSKGKRGELEFAAICRTHGYQDVHRGQQYSGASGDADVVGLPGVHVEVKRRESLNLYDAIGQAVRDVEAGEEDDLPMVAHRKNNCEWLITMRLDDWFEFYREWEAGQYLKAKEAQNGQG